MTDVLGPVPFGLPYPPERACRVLEVVGWPKRELARRIHTDEGSVRQMLRGARPIPDVLGMWLETLGRFHAALPEPFTWRPKGYQPDRSTSEAASEAASAPMPLDTDTLRSSVSAPGGTCEGAEPTVAPGRLPRTGAPCSPPVASAGLAVRTCRVCGCTEADCSDCVRRTGEPCYWVEDDLCSACVKVPEVVATPRPEAPTPAAPPGRVSSRGRAPRDAPAPEAARPPMAPRKQRAELQAAE